MTVVAISGTHGVGKTTLLSGLAKAGFPVLTFSVSRATQKKMGYASLAEAIDTSEKMKAFQTRLSMEKYKVDSPLQRADTLFLVDRSLADVAAYARAWAMRTGSQEVVDWAREFWDQCHEVQGYLYHGTLVLPPNPGIAFVPESRRGDAESREEIAQYIVDFMNDKEWKLLPRMRPVYSVALDERVREATHIIETFPL